jgi:hypothetical protein
LSRFQLSALEFEELAELLLEQPVEPSTASAAHPLPTAGELRQSIERHLQARDASSRSQEQVSPAEELNNALRDLRYSLG